MNCRNVEETDQIREALLGIYCALGLRTPYTTSNARFAPNALQHPPAC
jgi:hypothetical protein